MVFQIGPICLNVGERSWKRGFVRHGRSWCYFAGHASLAYWAGMSGFKIGRLP